MKAVKSKFGIIIALLLCVTVIGTCTFLDHAPEKSPRSNLDIAFIRQWKQEKEKLQKQYESKIVKLQSTNDSLQKTAAEKKKALAVYRLKAQSLQEQLKAAIVKADTSETIFPIAQNYFDAQAQSDSTCIETIECLTEILANRDSSILLYKKSETNLRDLQKEQQLREQLLTEQLNTAYKVQRRKTIQNKFLAGGLVFITGFTTTLLISQSLK